jgi:hypothetical protein
MFNLIVPAAYARRPCGLFMEIAACNIDTGNLECHEVIDGDAKKLTQLDLLPIVVREVEPDHFVLKEGICRFKKLVALGKRWILAIDERDSEYKYITHRWIVGRKGRKVHVVVLACAIKSWEEDPGVEDNLIYGLLGDVSDVSYHLVMLATLAAGDHLTMLSCPSAIIKNKYIRQLDQTVLWLLEETEELAGYY